MILKDSDVIFDELEHTYRDLAGNFYPSVSRVLEEEGYTGDAKRFYTEEARDRGTLIHAQIAMIDTGVIEPGSGDPEIGMYLEAWEEFKREQQVVVIETEVPFINRLFNYAGTYDRTAYLKEDYDELWGLDIKSGQPAAWHPLQLGLYNMAMGAKRLACVYVKKNGRYQLSEFDTTLVMQDVHALMRVRGSRKRTWKQYLARK